MEITSFSYNPDGTLTINIRELSVNGNLDNTIELSVEQTIGFLSTIGDNSKTILEMFKELVAIS